MLKFGTSGLRGLVTELTDEACYLYTTAFLQYVSDQKLVKKNSYVAIAGDFRPSTERILKACKAAIEDFGFKVDYCGIIPTQTVSLYGFKRNIPSIMVTGSHIPYDRNGIKFVLPGGEVLKKDEQNITEYYKRNSADFDSSKLFNKKGFLKRNYRLPKENSIAKREYVDRYLKFFKKDLLKNKTIVVFQHSAVIRDIMSEILKKMGAKVILVGRSEKFVPIDTEALQNIYLENAQLWARKYRADAVVSADGDSDRPLLFDENGGFIRGDFLGVICSVYLRADSVSATASSNTVLEKCKKFKKINRTKIGSPYVIEAMQNDQKNGYRRAVSYEANGGFLTGSDIILKGKELRALPTRDSMLPLLCALALSIEKKMSLSKLTQLFPQRFVYSDSIKGIPTETSINILQKISKGDAVAKKKAQELFGLPAEVKKITFLDGARMFLSNNEIVHIRPSGNSPEIRVYIEANTFLRAEKLTREILKNLAKLVK